MRQPSGSEPPALAGAPVKSSLVLEPVAGLARGDDLVGQEAADWALLPPDPSLKRRIFVGQLFKGLPRSRPEKIALGGVTLPEALLGGGTSLPWFSCHCLGVPSLSVLELPPSWEHWEAGLLWPVLTLWLSRRHPEDPHKSFRVTLGCVGRGHRVIRGQMGGALNPCSKQYTSSPTFTGL